MTFEQALADTERTAIAAGKAAADLAGALKQLQKAAAEGDVLKIRKASEELAVLLEATRQEVTNATSAWPFTPDNEEAYLKDLYAYEIIEVARRDGVQIQRADQGLVAFPSILRILPGERAVRIDRKKIRAVRPTRVVKALKAIQTRKPKASPEHFLEVLHRAYRLLTGRDYGTTIALASIYETLTLLPGAASQYDETDFARDLFFLDRSGLTRTRSGATFSLPASTGTKSRKGIYSFVAQDGETLTYFGIRFVVEGI